MNRHLTPRAIHPIQRHAKAARTNRRHIHMLQHALQVQRHRPAPVHLHAPNFIIRRLIEIALMIKVE